MSQIYFIFGIKLCMFRTVPLSIIRNFALYTQQWYISYRFSDSLLANYQHSFMTYTIVVCTAKNSMMDRGTVRNMQSFIPKIK